MRVPFHVFDMPEFQPEQLIETGAQVMLALPPVIPAVFVGVQQGVFPQHKPAKAKLVGIHSVRVAPDGVLDGDILLKPL